MANKTPKGTHRARENGQWRGDAPECRRSGRSGSRPTRERRSPTIRIRSRAATRGPTPARRFHPAREDHPFRPRAHPRAHRACARLRRRTATSSRRNRSPSSPGRPSCRTRRRRPPVFVRFSTVAGGAGSVDLPRDVRGFAVKFYTEEGNFDLVGNNIPVFFIQDAIKFPDLIHSVKMEPDRGFPQAGSAHDTFWDFASLMPESMHMLMWAMSDRAIPRSYRMIEGFGVHTFRLVDAKGKSTFVKFHWRPVARRRFGASGTRRCKISGADPDFHRRDLFDAIARGDFPEWEFCIQAFDQKTADAFEFDVLDATKLIPEEDDPARGRSARWCSTATPTTSSPRPSRSPSTPATSCRASTSPTIRCCRAGCSPTPTRSSSGSAGRTSTSSRSTGRAARCATSSATASSARTFPPDASPTSRTASIRPGRARAPNAALRPTRSRSRATSSASAPRASPITTARRGCSSAR